MSTFSEIVKKIRQSTVHIVICDDQNQSDGKYANIISSGTGFFVSDDGWLITSLHVIKGPEYGPGKRKVVGVFKKPDDTLSFIEANAITHFFPEIDVCAIKFSGLPEGTTTSNLSESAALQGENLGIFGYPDSLLNYDESGKVRTEWLKPRVSKCVLARIEKMDWKAGETEIKGKRLLETQFNFVKGNSGGPIFSEETGKIVGIVTGFRPVLQGANDYAAIFQNASEQLTGEAYYYPVDKLILNPGFSIKRVTSIAAVPYSYGVSCDEIRTSLNDLIQSL